jgi:hypothetical protein
LSEPDAVLLMGCETARSDGLAGSIVDIGKVPAVSCGGVGVALDIARAVTLIRPVPDRCSPVPSPSSGILPVETDAILLLAMLTRLGPRPILDPILLPCLDMPTAIPALPRVPELYPDPSLA